MRSELLPVWFVALAACGRLGFDAEGVDATSPMDASGTMACGTGGQAPASIQLAGEVFRYTTFVETEPVDGVAITVSDTSGTLLGATTSDALGAYAVELPLGGVERQLVITAQRDAFFITSKQTALVADRDLRVDVPMWADGSIDAVYGVGGETSRDPARGTITVEVTDCANAPIAGAMVTMDPAPPRMSYTGADGTPQGALTETTEPSVQAIGFNALPGPTRISVSKDGLVFHDQIVNVIAGDVVLRLDVHPAP